MSLFHEATAVLSLRRDSGGWGFRRLKAASAVIAIEPPEFRPGPLDYVMFVHGYNNSAREARDSYARFRGWLELLGAPARVLELHWPGDSLHGLGSASYWRQPAMALHCAPLLARWIKEAPADARFILVGHSLGCRLILETLNALSRNQRNRKIRGVCLMAAAVPVAMVQNRQLGPRSGEQISWHVLHSNGDNFLSGDFVLKFIFHAGQAAARDSLFTRAVGARGEPHDIWMENGRGRVEEMTDSSDGDYYRHGWYWPGGKTVIKCDAWAGAASLPPQPPPPRNQGRSARAVAQLLGRIGDRELAAARTLRSRTLGGIREFEERSIGDWGP